MQRRMLAVFCAFTALFSLLILRIGELVSGEELAETAQRQTQYTLTVETTRGSIYDTKMRKLTGGEKEYLVSVLPTAANIRRLSDDHRVLTPAEVITQKASEGYPFLVRSKAVISNIPQAVTFGVEKRTAEDPAAVHIVGYTDAAQKGITGIEKAFDEYLASAAEKTTVTYAVDALRQPLKGAKPEIRYAPKAVEGVVLTIDKRLQTICEETGSRYLKKGAVVLMEAKSGKLRACASFPLYDPDNLAAALSDTENAPLVNRAFSAYNLGSVFKTVVAAAMLECGGDPSAIYECTGSVTVGDTVFRCAHRLGQGELDLNEAMAQSCNPYFITQGLSVDPVRLRAIAADFSFGSRTVFAPGMASAGGSLPSVEELCKKGECANFCFGQGLLTATPVQAAQMMSGIANGGCVSYASLIEGCTNDGMLLAEKAASGAAVRAVSQKTAERVKEALVYAVMESEDHPARPQFTTAGGKTGTAQTGRYDENGKELLQGWFAGFFPAEEPKYVLVVLAEESEGSTAASPVFREIADAISKRNL